MEKIKNIADIAQCFAKKATVSYVAGSYGVTDDAADAFIQNLKWFTCGVLVGAGATAIALKILAD